MEYLMDEHLQQVDEWAPDIQASAYQVGQVWNITYRDGGTTTLAITDETNDHYYIELGGGGAFGIPKPLMEGVMADNKAEPAW